LFSSAAIICGAVSILGSYLPWASATFEWATGTLSRVLSEVWSLRLAGVVMTASGLVSLHSRWRWVLAVAVIAALGSAIVTVMAVSYYAAWQQRDAAATFSLDSGLLLASIAAAVGIFLAIFGAFLLIRRCLGTRRRA
jgi:hypothetical protein